MIAFDVFTVFFKTDFHRNSRTVLPLVTSVLVVMSYLLFGASVSILAFKNYEDVNKDWDRDIRFMKNAKGAGVCGMLAFFSIFPSLALLVWRTCSMLKFQCSKENGWRNCSMSKFQFSKENLWRMLKFQSSKENGL
ncbi:hypothetical protein CBR_g17041 [Chara braunii]|nr:hypothetical protein CBR_g17041 [Chara braunii]|eukprot:GBG73700.1 hypothetical protein CBR_g17041 [Chara braunii]